MITKFDKELFQGRFEFLGAKYTLFDFLFILFLVFSGISFTFTNILMVFGIAIISTSIAKEVDERI